MPSCAVSWCKNNSRTNKKSDGITFHLFPTNTEIKKKWVAAIRISRDNPRWQPSSTTVVCSAHFEESDLYNTTNDLRRVTKKGFPKKDLVKPGSGTNDKDVSTTSEHKSSSSRKVDMNTEVLTLPSISSVSENDFIKQETESDEDAVFTTVSIISRPSNFPDAHIEDKHSEDTLSSKMAVFTHNKPISRNTEKDNRSLQSITTFFSHNLPTSTFVVTAKDKVVSSSSSVHENFPTINNDSLKNDEEITTSSDTEPLNDEDCLDSSLEHRLKSKIKKQEEQLNSCRKKIKSLQQEVRRLKSRNVALKDKLGEKEYSVQKNKP